MWRLRRIIDVSIVSSVVFLLFFVRTINEGNRSTYYYYRKYENLPEIQHSNFVFFKCTKVFENL